MNENIKWMYWWPGIKKDVEMGMKTLSVKFEYQRSRVELQPLEIPS